MSTLKLIQSEIKRLESKAQDSTSGLTLEDVRKLEILIKSGQSLIHAPVEPPEQAIDDESYSDEDLVKLTK